MKKDFAEFGDFMKLDIRVGKVEKAQALENSLKLLELTVNFGEDYGTTTILAGLQQFFKPEELEGNQYLFIANLQPRPMAGSVSNGMLLAADNQNGPILIPVPESLKPGDFLR